MSDISATMVKELRNKTGAGIMDCKEALKINNGKVTIELDVDEHGVAIPVERAERHEQRGDHRAAREPRATGGMRSAAVARARSPKRIDHRSPVQSLSHRHPRTGMPKCDTLVGDSM